jgi:hypothetical protein
VRCWNDGGRGSTSEINFVRSVIMQPKSVVEIVEGAPSRRGCVGLLASAVREPSKLDGNEHNGRERSQTRKE